MDAGRDREALEEALAMLRLLEWQMRPSEIVDGIQQYAEWCPWCQISRTAGHSTLDCRLAGTLRLIEAALRVEVT